MLVFDVISNEHRKLQIVYFFYFFTVNDVN